MSETFPIDDDSGQVVGCPRVTDTIGKALRDMYGHPHATPKDMLAMLARMDVKLPTPR